MVQGERDSAVRSGYVIVPDARDAKILLRISGTGWTLPEISLAGSPRWSGATREINRQVRETLGLEGTVLRCLESCEPFAIDDRLEAYVIEGQQLSWARPSGTDWFGPEEIDELRFIDERHLEVVRRYFGQGNREPVPSWSRHGWMGSALAWVESEFERLGLRSTGRIEQVSWSPVTTVLCAISESGPVFLKACADPVAHEPELTCSLASELPDLFPRVLACDSKRRFLLMGGGGEHAPLDLERAAGLLRGLAQLQAHCAERPERLLELGCPDHRPDAARALVSAALGELLDQLELSSDLPKRALARLSQRVAEVDHALTELGRGEIPPSLDHPDFSSRSAITRDVDVRVLGWSGALAHPFFTPLALIREFSDPTDQARLLDAYLGPWGGFAPRERLLELHALARESEPAYRLLRHRELLRHAESSSDRAALREQLDALVTRLAAE